MGYPVPDNVPGHLEPLIYAASLEADREFPRPNQAKRRIRFLVFAFAEILYVAAKNEEMPAHLAVDALRDFLYEVHNYDSGLPQYLPKYYERSRGTERFQDVLRQEIEDSDEWRRYIQKFADLVLSKRPQPDSATVPSGESRRSLRDSYLATFPAAKILDICWAARQHYSEWKRWIRGAVKDGSSPDRAFRNILKSGKSPSEYRKEARKPGWK